MKVDRFISIIQQLLQKYLRETVLQHDSILLLTPINHTCYKNHTFHGAWLKKKAIISHSALTLFYNM